MRRMENPFRHTTWVPIRSMLVVVLSILAFIAFLYLVVVLVGLVRLA